MLQGKYLWYDERVEYIAIVYDTEEPDIVLSIGCEMTIHDIETWMQLAMDNEPWIAGNPAAPDMYDRSRRH